MKSKKVKKEEQNIYISHKIVFKKQSETIDTKIKDKEIDGKKRDILKLFKNFSEINDQLVKEKNQYQQKRAQYNAMFHKLSLESKQAKQSLFKLEIKKCRLLVIEKPELRDLFANSVKKYLSTWVAYKKFRFVLSVHGIETAKVGKWIAQRAELIYLIKPQISKYLHWQKCFLLNDQKNLQMIFINVKRSSIMSEKQYLLEVYSLNGKYFYIGRKLTQSNYQQLQHRNLMKNLMIFPKHRKLLLLSQFFADPQNVRKVERTLKIFQFQIEILKEKKKIVFFKCFKLSNIFESVYSVPGFEQISLQVLFMIKRKEVKAQVKEDDLIIYSKGVSKNSIKYEKAKSLNQYHQNYEFQQQQPTYTLICEPIKSYQKKFMFKIENQSIITSQETIPLFFHHFQSRYLIQLDNKKMLRKEEHVDISSHQRKNSHYQIVQALPRLVERRNFSMQGIIQKIILIQKVYKMIYSRRRYFDYKKESKRLKNVPIYVKIEGNIIISTYVRKGFLIFFVQCLSMSSPKSKLPKSHDYLRFPQKYFGLSNTFMQSEELCRISKKCLVWQIEDEISQAFEQAITKYQDDEIKKNELKPVKALNRLKRLLISTILKMKKKKNILHIKKIQKNWGTFVLIIRKSQIIKNMVEVHLYHLEKQQRRGRRKGQRKEVLIEQARKPKVFQNQNGRKQGILINRSQKIRFPPISISLKHAEDFVSQMRNISNLSANRPQQNKKFRNYDRSIESQFYITDRVFIFKPLHNQMLTGQYKFIERLSSVNIGCQEIKTQVENMGNSRHPSEQSTSKHMTRVGQKERSLMKASKISHGSIRYDNEQNEQVLSLDQQIFYALYKDKDSIFYFQFFVLKSGQSQYFKSVHKTQISKKQVSSSSWSIVYKVMGAWLYQSPYLKLACKMQSRALNVSTSNQIQIQQDLLQQGLHSEIFSHF